MFSSSSDEGTVEQRPVKLGSRQGQMQVVTEGLKPDDMVVVNGIQRARPGAKVTPVRQQQAAAEGKKADAGAGGRAAGDTGASDTGARCWGGHRRGEETLGGRSKMFSKFFINRPIFATVIAVLTVLAGLVTAISLPISQYPDITPPVVQVTTSYPGASARTVVDTVALPVEQQVNGVENMLYMQSTSASDGTYKLLVTFAVGTDLDFAQVLVQNRVASAMAQLPPQVAQQGVVTKKVSTAILQVVSLTSPDGAFDSLYLSNYATINLVDVLKRLEGVGDVNVFGAGQYSMRIWLNPDQLKTRNITTTDVVNAVQGQNNQVASGQLGAPPAPNDQDFQLTLNVQGRLDEAKDFENIIVKIEPGEGGRITRVKDVARVELGAQTYSQFSRLDGQPSAGIAVYQLPGANALDVAAAVRGAVADLSQSFPEDLTYSIAFDTTVFTTDSIHEVYKTLFEAAILVFLVIFLFLQEWRATLIPAITIPVSLIGTFALMALFGISINTISLFGLVLAIGIVVDDAIVVVENVWHNMETHGLGAHDASIKAMDEISGPIIAITLVLMAVFIPAALMPGITGQLYRQFAITIAASTFFSAVNALTLSPALCALLLKPPQERRFFIFRWFNAAFGKLAHAQHSLVTPDDRPQGAGDGAVRRNLRGRGMGLPGAAGRLSAGGGSGLRRGRRPAPGRPVAPAHRAGRDPC